MATAGGRSGRTRNRRLRWWLAQAREQPLAAVGAFLVTAWVLIAVFAPLIAPYSAVKGDFYNLQAAPSLQHLFGTDDHGRDVLSRVIYGSRSVLLLSGISTLVSLICGTIIALVAGYYG